MSTEPTNLELVLPAITPALPLVLADRAFLSTLATVEGQVAALRITDAATQQIAADLQIRLTSAGGALEKERIKIKQPFLDKCRDIDAAARPVTLRIDTAKAVIRKALTDFAVEQARLAAVAEAARQAELRRLEAIRLAEERAAQEKAAALARQAALAQAERDRAAEAARLANLPPPVEMLDMDDCPDDVPAPQKTETEKAIEAVRYAAPAPVAKPIGITMRRRLVLRVVNPKLVPDVFAVRTINEAAIRATFCSGWKPGEPLPEVGGCVFEVEETAVSTGRGF
jgi:hypothetical protein